MTMRTYAQAIAVVAGVTALAAPALAQETIRLRIASGHAAPTAYVNLMTTYFVPEVVKRVAERTKYKVEFVEGYGGSMVKVEMLTKPGCGLCDDARDVIERVGRDVAIDFQVRDISDDPELLARFGEEIPVIFVGGRKAFKYRVEEAELRRRLTR